MTNAQVDRRALVGRWGHSHEEDHVGLTVFRSADHAFPRSRGRVFLDLLDDGTAKVEHPGPTDRRVTSVGHWALDGNRLRVVTSGWSAELEIQTIDAGRFVARKR